MTRYDAAVAKLDAYSEKEAMLNAFDELALKDIKDGKNLKLPPFCDSLNNLPYGLGIIQNYIYGQMKYPSRPTAGITAIAALSYFSMRNITIRSFSGLGFNEYFVILAPTGFGKEDLRTAINTLYKAMNEKIKQSDYMDDGYLAEIQYAMPASPQGLHRQLETCNAQFYMADEFAEWLTQTKSDSHKQGAIGYCMEIYSKALGSVNVPHAITNAYEPVNSPRVGIFATSTAERMMEAMTSSQADSGTYNRCIFFVGEQERIEKKYSGQIYKPSDECTTVLEFIVKACKGDELHFRSDAWDYFKDYDSRIIEPLRFDDNTLAGRLSEQAIKLAGLIALSDERVEITATDLKTAFEIRENLYQRFKAFINHHGAISDMHPTAIALKQLRDVLKKKATLRISDLEKFSRAFKKLKTSERESVKRELLNEGSVYMEGKRFVSTVME